MAQTGFGKRQCRGWWDPRIGGLTIWGLVWMAERLVRWLDGYVMGRWTTEWVDIRRWLDGWIDIWKDGGMDSIWKDRWMNGYVDGQVDEWMDG